MPDPVPNPGEPQVQLPSDAEWEALRQQQLGVAQQPQQAALPTQQDVIAAIAQNPVLVQQIMQQAGIQGQITQQQAVPTYSPVAPAPQEKLAEELRLEELKRQKIEMEQRFTQPGYNFTAEDNAAYQTAIAQIGSLEATVPILKQQGEFQRKQQEMFMQMELQQVPSYAAQVLAYTKEHAPYLYWTADGLFPIPESVVLNQAAQRLAQIIRQGRGAELRDANAIAPHFWQFVSELQGMRQTMAVSKGQGGVPQGVPPSGAPQPAGITPQGEFKPSRDLDL